MFDVAGVCDFSKLLFILLFFNNKYSIYQKIICPFQVFNEYGDYNLEINNKLLEVSSAISKMTCVDDQLTGQMCALRAGKVIITEYNVLMVPIPSKTRIVKLEDLFNRYIDSAEQFVGQYAEHTYIQIIRQSLTGKKIKTPLAFPTENLKLRSKLGYGLQKFNLKSLIVIVHVGNEITQGHYYSLCLKQNKWFKFSDERVQCIDVSKLISSKEISENCCLLVYDISKTME